MNRINYSKVPEAARETIKALAKLAGEKAALNAVKASWPTAIERGGMVENGKARQVITSTLLASGVRDSIKDVFTNLQDGVIATCLTQDTVTDRAPTGIKGSANLFSIDVGEGFEVVVTLNRASAVDEHGKAVLGAYRNQDTGFTLQKSGDLPDFGDSYASGEARQ